MSKYPNIGSQDDKHQYETGDLFSYGRKKSKESGKVTSSFLKQRNIDYAQYGIGIGVGMMGNFNDKRTSKKKFGKKGWKS